MARTFDRTKPYGTVHGDDGRAYEQNGVYFDAQGKEWVEPAPPPKTYTQEEVDAMIAAAKKPQQ